MVSSLLTVHQAAERLGVSFWTLYRMARAGQVPSIRLGRRRLFAAEDLDELVRRTREDSGSPGQGARPTKAVSVD